MGQLRLLGEPPASDDHAALANLAFPQAGHTGFVAAAGLAGGQTIVGGTAAGENLSLQSTAHAARGVVQIIDALRLASGIIQDSGGNARIALAAASPQVTLAGDVRAGDRLGVATIPSPTVALKLRPSFAMPTGNMYLIDAGAESCEFNGAGTGNFFGFYCQPTVRVTSPAVGNVYGLNFLATGAGTGNFQNMYACWTKVGLAFYTGAAYNLWCFYAKQPGFLAATKPANAIGMEIEDMGGYSAATNAIGLKIADQTVVTGNKYLIDAGPTTPYFRLIGGASPGANLTNLYLAEGAAPTLRRVQWVDPGNGGANLVAGQRVMVLV